MRTSPLVSLGSIVVVLTMGILNPAQAQKDFSPPPDEQQLPGQMHSEMKELPSVTVGRRDAQIIGADNKALQAAVDYIAGLGGGTVEIGAGEYVMRDSLHLRANVTVRGTKAPAKDGSTLFTLPKPGEYRVRLFPTERTFLDPPFEWWFKISVPKRTAPGPRRGQE